MSDRTDLSPYMRSLAPDTDSRHAQDFYPTPPGAVTPLLRRESFPGQVWDPCCGFGGIARTMAEWGWCVQATDLVDRGYGAGGRDFLIPDGDAVDHVVCNPPFKHAQAFAERGLAITTGKVAIFARLQWLEGQSRAAWLQRAPLARVWVFENRVPFQRGRLPQADDGGRTTAYAWFVFDHSHVGAPVLDWVRYEETALCAT